MNQGTCEHCDEPVAPKQTTGPRPKYCSRRCANAASYARRKDAINAARRAANAALRREILKVCDVCGTEFSPRLTIKQIYCSQHCLAKATRDSKSKTCSEPGCDRFVRANDLCNSHYKKARREVMPEDRTIRNGDPVKRAAALREKSRFRKSVERATDAEMIDLTGLGARDDWTCGICGEPVDQARQVPDRMAPTIDHITPISHGGRHRWDNVQLSHFACNMAKADTIAA